MTFDPNQKRDEDGKWTSGGVPSSESAKKAIDWIKSEEAKSMIKDLAAPERIKSAATFAIQGALFSVGGVNDPNIDSMVKNQVDRFANDVKVTRAHARQMMLAVIERMLKK